MVIDTTVPWSANITLIRYGLLIQFCCRPAFLLLTDLYYTDSGYFTAQEETLAPSIITYIVLLGLVFTCLEFLQQQHYPSLI